MNIDYFVLIEATLVITVVGVIALRAKLLDRLGGVSAVLVGYLTYIGIGRVGMSALMTFFLVAGVLSRYKASYKRSITKERSVERTRGWRNVWGNGLVPVALAVLSIVDEANRDLYTVAYIGSISAAFADTLATEIGLLYRGPTRSIIGLREVEAGMPGGITPYGIAGSIASGGALFLSVFPFITTTPNGALHLATIIMTSGILGSLADSLIGQLCQSMYLCRNCRSLVEEAMHCGEKAEHVKGLRFISTHAVNAIATFVGGLVAALLWFNMSV